MKRFLIILIFIFAIFSCKEDDPAPYYEVVPVVEVFNAHFNDVYVIRLNTTLDVNGIPVTQLWDIQYKGIRWGCNRLKWVGEPVEYQAPTLLKFTVQVLYKVTENGGFIPIENFEDGYLPKEATWIRVYFEVRDRNNPSDRFVGIEQYSNPANDEYQAPTVEWNVTTDFNFVPINQPSPDSGARISAEEKCEDCIWTENN